MNLHFLLIFVELISAEDFKLECAIRSGNSTATAAASCMTTSARSLMNKRKHLTVAHVVLFAVFASKLAQTFLSQGKTASQSPCGAGSPTLGFQLMFFFRRTLLRMIQRGILVEYQVSCTLRPQLPRLLISSLGSSFSLHS